MNDPTSFRPARRARWGTLIAALAACVTASLARPASAQTISETVRGGLAVDAVGMESTPTAFASGSFHVRLPAASRVRRAILYTATLWNQRTDIPAGPTGSPRLVEVGTGATAVSRTLEGAADRVVDQTGGFAVRWGTWRTDVTRAVQGVVGPAATGTAVINVPVRERGDATATNPADPPFQVFPLILGHTLVVEYELDDGPLRNVAVLELNAIGDDVARMFRLPGPIANRCPAANPRGETFPASLSVAFEYDNPYPAEENGVVTANGMRLTGNAGGSDDWDDNLGTHAPPPQGRNASWAGLITAGSFGGVESSPGVAIGSPVGVDNDTFLGAVRTPPPRLDDELYDFRPFVADNDPTVTLRYVADTDSYLTVLAIQTLARASATDADGDTHLDAAEGDCTTDTDNDGTPDYLDLDSDNDCLPDQMESAAGRTDAAVPGAANANCPSAAPFCERGRGVCQCRSAMDCAGAAAPICDLGTRRCVPCTANDQCAALGTGLPVCVTVGAAAGRCAQCSTADVSACPDSRRLCDPTTLTCVGCVTGADCRTPVSPICDPVMRLCRACNSSTQASDCPTTAAPVCATGGANAGRCVACTPDPGGMRGACSGATPLCTTEASTPNVCVGCNVDGDCSGATPLCDRATRTCRGCSPSNAADCTGGRPVCATAGPNAGRCVQCTATNPGACAAPTVCNAASNTCVGCTTNADCRDPARPFCNMASSACRGCDPMSATDCTGATPVCATTGANAGRCVQCAPDRVEACPGTAPLCDATSNRCVQCNTGTDCLSLTPVCDPATRACRACGASDCSGERPVCAMTGPNAGRCVQCAAGMTAACAAPTVCDPATNQCVGCNSNAECRDSARPICNTALRICEPCDPRSPTDCTGERSVCATSGPNAGRCVQCTPERPNACASGMVCDPTTSQCVGCTGNADCRDPNRPFCNPSTRVCRPCDPMNAADCTGATPVCLTGGASAGRCVQCTTSQTGACVGDTARCDPDMNLCVGCLTRADCGEGRLCNTLSRRCEMDPDFRPDAGMKPADAGMDGGLTPRGDLGGGGCGCRAPGDAPTAVSPLWLAAIGLSLARRRRRGGPAARP